MTAAADARHVMAAVRNAAAHLDAAQRALDRAAALTARRADGEPAPRIAPHMARAAERANEAATALRQTAEAAAALDAADTLTGPTAAVITRCLAAHRDLDVRRRGDALLRAEAATKPRPTADGWRATAHP